MDKFSTPKGRAIRRQAFLGLGIVLLAVGFGVLLAQGHDPKVLDRDPTPLMPAIVVGMLGTLLIVVARFRWMFYRPKDELGRVAKKGIVRIVEEIVN